MTSTITHKIATSLLGLAMVGGALAAGASFGALTSPGPAPAEARVVETDTCTGFCTDLATGGASIGGVGNGASIGGVGSVGGPRR